MSLSKEASSEPAEYARVGGVDGKVLDTGEEVKTGVPSSSLMLHDGGGGGDLDGGGGGGGRIGGLLLRRL